MTLAQWLQIWPYKGRHYYSVDSVHWTPLGPIGETPNGQDIYVVPDTIESTRSQAWNLEDYRVTSVTGGSIWFAPRRGEQ